jgi:WD40 repeat protein
LLTSDSVERRKGGEVVIYELAADFSSLLAHLPGAHRRRSLLQRLQEGLNAHVFGVGRHPTILFQSLWNTCWWYDCPESEHHYEEPKDGWPEGMPPWSQDGPKLHRLLETWRAALQRVAPDRKWLRSLRPPAISLGSGQQAEIRRPSGTFGRILLLQRDAVFLAEHDGILSIWDIASRSEVETVRIADGPLARWVKSGCGTRIAGHSRAGELLVWDVREQRRLFVREGVNVNNFLYLKFRDDGRLLAVNAEGTVTVYDIDAQREISSFGALSIGPHNPFHSDVFFLDDRTLGVGIEDYRDQCNKVVLFDIFSLETTGTIRLPLYSRPQSLKFEFHRATAQLLVIAGTRAYLVDTRTGTMRFMLGIPHGRPGIFQNNHEGQYIRGEFSPAGGLIATCGDDSDRSIRLWDPDSGRFCGCNSESHRGAVYSVDFLPGDDGERFLISSGADGAVRIWDRYESRTPLRLPHLDVRRIDSIACSDTGTLFACGGDNYSVYVYDGRHGVQRYEFGGGDEFERLAFSPDGKHLYTGEENGLSECDLVCGSPHTKYQGAPGSLDRAILSSDNRLVVGTGFGGLAVWRKENHIPLFTVKDYGYGYPTLCALSPDGTTVALASHYRVDLWNIQGHRLAQWRLPVELSGAILPSCNVADGSVKLTVERWEYEWSLSHPHLPPRKRRATSEPTIDSCCLPGQPAQKVTRAERRYSWDVNYSLSWDLLGADPAIMYMGVAIDPYQICYSHDRRLIVAKSLTNYAIWEVGQSEPLWTGPSSSFSECALSSDGSYLLFATVGSVEVRTRAGELLAKWAVPVEATTPLHLSFTQDGRFVSLAVDDWETRWSVAEPDSPPTLRRLPPTSDSSGTCNNDWRVHVTALETTLVDAETGAVIAWYPVRLEKVISHVGRNVLAGAHLNHFVLLELTPSPESVPQALAGCVPVGPWSRPRKLNLPTARHLSACHGRAILCYLAEVLGLVCDRILATPELRRATEAAATTLRLGAEGRITRGAAAQCQAELAEVIAWAKGQVNDSAWQELDAKLGLVAALLKDLKVVRCVLSLASTLMLGVSHQRLAAVAAETTKQLLESAGDDASAALTHCVWNVWRWARETQMREPENDRPTRGAAASSDLTQAPRGRGS